MVQEKIKTNDESAPVAKIVSVIIKHAIEGRASDIHIEPQASETRVRYRIDGILYNSLLLPKNVHNAIVDRLKVLANLKIEENRLPQQGRFELVEEDASAELLVSVIPLAGNEKVTIKIFSQKDKVLPLDFLGLNPYYLQLINDNIFKNNGLFLLAGPVDSGKTTTSLAILNKINREGVDISTLEDPIEIMLPGLNQTQIKNEIGFTFANGLRSVLRQDPNVIMLSDLPDSETAELAVHASLSGHFVLAGLAATDVVSALLLMFEMKTEPFLLSSALNIIVAQRLLRRVCPYCRAEDKIDGKLAAKVEEEFSLMPKEIIAKALGDNFNIKRVKFYKSVGCPRCGQLGYAGRIAVSEVMVANEEIKKIITEKGKKITEKELAAAAPFVSLRQDAILKVLEGVTTLEEAKRVFNF